MHHLVSDIRCIRMYLILFTVFTNDVIAWVVEWEGKTPNSDNKGLAPPTTPMLIEREKGDICRGKKRGLH